MSGEMLPFELVEFQRLIQKPAGDPTGLAGFFNSARIHVSRVPARLDVMGGIADYSGANVCEAVLGRGMLMALQPRTDRTLRIRTMQYGKRSLPVETRIPLDYFSSGGSIAGYNDIREFCLANPLAGWAAYIGGSIFTLLKEESVDLAYGFNLLLLSAVPMNVGIMDQTAITSGKHERLLHILCRPGSVVGEVRIPGGCGFVGINSMVRHSVAANPYSDVRIGAFMGKRIINDIRERKGHEPVDYLTEISVEELKSLYLHNLPETMLGSDFCVRHKTHDDPVTKIQPDATYRVRGPACHPIEENERVLRFIEALRNAQDGDETALVAAGEAMYGAHESYRNNCNLSVEEVDFLVNAVKRRGPGNGLYGAKITGGGTGGTVAVFGKLEALREHIPKIAVEYSRRSGAMPDIFEGTSPGAMEFGSRRYVFGAIGWERVEE
jgi:galactokinase